MKKFSPLLMVVMIILLNVGADQATKVLARNHLQGAGEIQVVGTVFTLTYHENAGAFLGMGDSLSPVLRVLTLVVLPILMILGLLVYMAKTPGMSRGEQICMATIIGGGIGNLIDRIAFGVVTDFMHFGVGRLRTGILNVADLSITFGVIVMLILMYRVHRKEKKENTEKTAVS
jgi:signal peptidase II